MAHAYGLMVLATFMIIVKVSNGTLMDNVRRYPIIVRLMDPIVFLLQNVLKLTHKEAAKVALMVNVLKVN